MNEFSLASGFLISAFGIVLAYFAILLYTNSLFGKTERCHLRNSYPFQFYRNDPIPCRIVLYLFLALDAIALSLGDVFYFSSLGTSLTIALGVFFGISALALIIANLLPLTNYKAHIFFAGLAFFVYSLASILYSFLTLIPGNSVAAPVLSVPISVVVGILGFVSFFALFNPKLLSWAKMDKAEENGKTYYVKPKVNFLALYEWIYLILMNVTGFLFFLDIIVTDAISFTM
jgi:hypothetical protein